MNISPIYRLRPPDVVVGSFFSFTIAVVKKSPFPTIVKGLQVHLCITKQPLPRPSTTINDAVVVF